MRFDVLTLFPQMFEAVLLDSIIGRAVDNGLINLNFINIRDFSQNKHHKVDDTPYGGGSGMVMAAQPIVDAYESIVPAGTQQKPLTVYLSPQGSVFDQQTAIRFAREERIVLLCGHYEGIDERAIEEIVDMELSVGNFVLTGGEIPAMAVIDATCRMVPGVLSSAEAYEGESLYRGLLEYPQYTRPPEYRGRPVPDILLSGHHKNIELWRLEQSVLRTLKKRPDLLKSNDYSEEILFLIEKLKKDL